MENHLAFLENWSKIGEYDLMFLNVWYLHLVFFYHQFSVCNINLFASKGQTSTMSLTKKEKGRKKEKIVDIM